MDDKNPEVKPWAHFYWDIFANTCWPFDEDVIVCGRTEGHFQYEDAELSGAHCQFSIENGKCFLTDLGSKNGTYLNEKELPGNIPAELRCFDIIIFGSQIIIYFNEEVFKIKTRDEILLEIEKNTENKNIYNEIKNKTIIFMKAHHPRMMVRKKVQIIENRIAEAYNLKEEKLSKYDDKVKELNDIAEQHKSKIKQIDEKIQQVLIEKEKLAAKIDPQIESLHKQKDQFEDEYENIEDGTSI